MHLLNRRFALLAAASLSIAAFPLAHPAANTPAEGTHLDGFEADLGTAAARIEVAQGYGRQPGESAGADDTPYGAPRTDSAGLLLRIDRLESQLRQVTGQLEQAQFATRKLEEQLKKFQLDVEYRFQELGGQNGTPPAPSAKPPQKRTEGQDPVEGQAPGTRSAKDATDTGELPAVGRPGRRGDAFDPATDPSAPGAPRPLGSQASTRTLDTLARSTPRAQQTANAWPNPDAEDPDAPLDLSGGKLRARPPASPDDMTTDPPGSPGRPQGPARPLPGPAAADAGPAQAQPSVNPAKEEFDLALGLLKQKEYESAERSFTAFLQKNPKSRMTSDAIYYLGESFYQRGRQREAAEQYLKVSTQYASSARAPDALLRLGQSLSALGAREQACAAYGEITRKHPNASAAVKSGAEREARRLQC